MCEWVAQGTPERHLPRGTRAPRKAIYRSFNGALRQLTGSSRRLQEPRGYIQVENSTRCHTREKKSFQMPVFWAKMD